MIGIQLFEGVDIRLTALEPEKDALLHSTWMHDQGYASLIHRGTYRNLAPFEAKKQFEEMQKAVDEKRDQFYFAIRMKTDDRLVGFFFIPYVEWSNAAGFMCLALAELEDLEKYGREALEMALTYIFTELNLYRITVMLPEYSRPVIDLFERSGFVMEARLREYCYKAGRWWDMFDYGCVLEDYQKVHGEGRHE
jgi:RimJ/RimL family protein N-acetyltransferase